MNDRNRTQIGLKSLRLCPWFYGFVMEFRPFRVYLCRYIPTPSSSTFVLVDHVSVAHVPDFKHVFFVLQTFIEIMSMFFVVNFSYEKNHTHNLVHMFDARLSDLSPLALTRVSPVFAELRCTVFDLILSETKFDCFIKRAISGFLITKRFFSMDIF